MFIKNIVGIIIILLNTAGLSVLIYMGVLAFIKKRRKQKKPEAKQRKALSGKPGAKPAVKDKKMFEDDEDDLLKDMDLSDLDDIDLDDFK